MIKTNKYNQQYNTKAVYLYFIYNLYYLIVKKVNNLTHLINEECLTKLDELVFHLYIDYLRSQNKNVF